MHVLYCQNSASLVNTLWQKTAFLLPVKTDIVLELHMLEMGQKQDCGEEALLVLWS